MLCKINKLFLHGKGRIKISLMPLVPCVVARLYRVTNEKYNPTYCICNKVYVYLHPKKRVYFNLKATTMYWTLELASYLDDAPWPATKEQLIDFADRIGAPIEVIENLEELDDDDFTYESIEEIWPEYPTKDDFLFNEDEY